MRTSRWHGSIVGLPTDRFKRRSHRVHDIGTRAPLQANLLRWTALVVTAVATALAGCASRSGPSASSGAAAGPASGTASTATPAPLGPRRQDLEAEYRRLAALFRGTPVAFSMDTDSVLRISVPLRYSFDAGRAAVKPPLGAVLDRIARSQREQATKFAITAPSDPKAKGTLVAASRASATRDYLVSRGIEATRVSVAAAPSGAAVTLVISEPEH